jgi:MOSC domain-containing protein YiiM
MTGRVETIVLRRAPGEAPNCVERAQAIAGRGLDGDRYCTGDGTFSATPGTGRNLTLVEAEALEALAAETGIRLAPEDTRRNVVTRGIALNGLVGQRFRVGEVECHGQRLCEPCEHLESLTEEGVLRGLVHRGGLRADILTDGEIAAGDLVTRIGEEEQ